MRVEVQGQAGLREPGPQAPGHLPHQQGVFPDVGQHVMSRHEGQAVGGGGNVNPLEFSGGGVHDLSQLLRKRQRGRFPGHQDHGVGGDALLPAGKAHLLGAGGLDAHRAGIEAQDGGDFFDHPWDVGR